MKDYGPRGGPSMGSRRIVSAPYAAVLLGPAVQPEDHRGSEGCRTLGRQTARRKAPTRESDVERGATAQCLDGSRRPMCPGGARARVVSAGWRGARP
jgi:hypothetical protein